MCTSHSIVYLRCLSESSLHSPNYLDQLKISPAIAGNYIQTPKCETLRAVPYSKCKCQSMHAAVETFLGSQAAALWRFSSSCFLRRKEALFTVPWTPFPKQLSVPHVLASSFTIRNTFPSLPSVHVCSASCQSKTSSCFPVPCGLCMPSLVLPAFSSPKDKSLGTETQKLSCSRAVEALPRRASLTSVSCWVPSPAALRLWSWLWHDLVVPLAWLLHCFKGRTRGVAVVLKHSSSCAAQSLCRGAGGSLSVMQHFSCRRAADEISPQHVQVLFAVEPLLVLHADGGMCPQESAWQTHASPAEKERDFGVERCWAGAVMLLASCSASCPALQPLSKAVGRARQTLPAENKSQISAHGCQSPAEVLKFTWSPGWCWQAGLQRPRCSLCGHGLHAGAGLAEQPWPALRALHRVASHPVTHPFLPEGRSGCSRTAARAAWGRAVAEQEAQGPGVTDSSQRAGSVICLLLFRLLGGVLSLAPHQQSTCQQVCAPTAWPLTSTHSSTN